MTQLVIELTNTNDLARFIRYFKKQDSVKKAFVENPETKSVDVVITNRETIKALHQNSVNVMAKYINEDTDYNY